MSEDLLSRPMEANLSGRVQVERVGRDDMSLRALATLRMTVFRAWPYLYDGSVDYEAAYLREFLSDEAAVLVVARLGEIPVGMATASPMATQSEAVRAPFVAANADVERIFYFGESVLLAQFRGLGLGHRFFDEREAAARTAGAASTTFCAVAREADHPSRPQGARDLAPFWKSRGYPFGPMYRMLILTGQRRAEIGEMERGWRKDVKLDMDDEETVPAVIVPPSKHKSRRGHTFYLSPPAVAILDSLPAFKDKFLFSSTGGKTPVRTHTWQR